MTIARGAVALAAAALAACSGESEDCEAPCQAEIHFFSQVGVPVDADPVTVRLCRGQACAALEIAIPVETTTDSIASDPALTATVRRTDEPFHADFQGVFQFDATWSSASQRIEEGDYVTGQVTDPDGGNVTLIGHSVASSEVVGSCGCPRIELAN